MAENENDDGFALDAAGVAGPEHAGTPGRGGAPGDADVTPVLNIMTPGSVKMNNFNGNAPWRTWKNQFDRIAQMNGWTDKVNYLWIHLEGDALQFVDELPNALNLHYDELCELIKQRFSAERLSNVQKAELLSRRRAHGENLPQLGQDIRHLVNGAYPSFNADAKEEIAIEKFLDALRPELRRNIYQQNPITLAAAIEHGLKLEAWGMVEEQKHGSTVRQAVETEDEQVRLLKDLQKRMDDFQSKKKENYPRSAMKCFYCEKQGHIARDCYSKKRDEANQRGKETTTPAQSTMTCYRCGGRGHKSVDCATPPAEN